MRTPLDDLSATKRIPESTLRISLCVGGLVLSLLLLAPATAEAHGGGPEGIISFSGLVNWMHLAGTVAWLGGIIVLRVVLAPSLKGLGPDQRAPFMETVLRRYTHLAWWGIATLFFTGLLTTWAHVPEPDTFTGTTYGLILTAKILLAVGMVACTLAITLAARGSRLWRRWSRPATRVNLVLTGLMLLSIAGLVEFERTPASVVLNLVYYAALTVWLGGLVFIPLVFGPSLPAVEESARSRLAAAVLARYHRLAWPAALVAILSSVLLAARGVDDLDDLWTDGFGIASGLHVLSLAAVLIVMLVVRFTPQDVLRHTTGSLAAFTPTLLIGALALLFFAFGGALYEPASSAVGAEIPLAAKSGAGPALAMLEPLGYVIALFVAGAIIWHFAVVEKGPGHEAR